MLEHDCISWFKFEYNCSFKNIVLYCHKRVDSLSLGCHNFTSSLIDSMEVIGEKIEN